MERFWSKVRVGDEDECWEWMACKFPAGYGLISVRDVSHSAHRVCWELSNGKIPDGAWVLHKCDNPSCVNPKHLFLGTSQDNVDDKVYKNRQHRPIGSLHPGAVLDETKAMDILNMREDGFTPREISASFRLHYNTVYNVLSGLHWGHVQQQEKRMGKEK